MSALAVLALGTTPLLASCRLNLSLTSLVSRGQTAAETGESTSRAVMRRSQMRLVSWTRGSEKGRIAGDSVAKRSSNRRCDHSISSRSVMRSSRHRDVRGD